jgi:hypothetical protein
MSVSRTLSLSLSRAISGSRRAAPSALSCSKRAARNYAGLLFSLGLIHLKALRL